jgi:hypothetical protein
MGLNPLSKATASILERFIPFLRLGGIKTTALEFGLFCRVVEKMKPLG